ncbi:MAG: dicarboxylate/amino acid:cation symporter [Saprospiraceae bacterium]
MEARKSLLFALASVGAVALIHLLPKYAGIAIEPNILTALRWWAIGALCWYGIKRNSLTTWIILSMAIGLEVGVDFPSFAGGLEIFSKIFIQLIKTVIAPLLFGTLVVGIAGHSNMKQVGRMGVKAIIYFEIATTIALFVGLAAINFSKAGEGISHPAATVSEPVKVPGNELVAVVDSVKGTYKLQFHGKDIAAPVPPVKQDWKKIVLHTFPENVAKMVYEGAVLQIVVFSLLFGFGLTRVSEHHRKIMLDWTESLTEVMFKFTGLIMYMAPFAVGGAIAYTVGTMGFGVVGNLVKLLATLYAALIVFILLVFIPVMLICKIPIRNFFRAVYEPASLAFATASSEAALPKALTAMENFGVPRKIVSFVLPTGYSFNLDGSTLYLALASVFCAQAAGIQLDWGTQLLICLTLMLTSKGVAGVPRASLVILAGTVNQFGIPEWPIAVILGVDALMDMGRTSVNLMGNCLASAVVARWEGEFDAEKAGQV